jgi:hypothetical protein
MIVKFLELFSDPPEVHLKASTLQGRPAGKDPECVAASSRLRQEFYDSECG